LLELDSLIQCLFAEISYDSLQFVNQCEINSILLIDFRFTGLDMKT